MAKLDDGAVEFAPDPARCLSEFQPHHPFDLDRIAPHLVKNHAQSDARDG